MLRGKKMTIYDTFLQKVSHIQEDELHESELKTISVRLSPKEVKTADYLAKMLGESRQSILNEILVDGLKQALFGYFNGSKISGDEAVRIQSELSGYSTSEDQEELDV